MRMTLFLLILPFFISCGDDLTPPVIPPPADVVVAPFTDIPELEEMVVYEVNLRSVSNNGGFAGVEAHLDHMAALGVNVIWLMPIHPVGIERGINSPYAVRNYTEVNPEFGTLNDFKKLVNAAHAKGMAVILDWVANHTSWDNPWVSEHPEWYTQDASGNITSPPGTTWTDVADLNFNSRPMREEMIRSMRYWVDSAGVDGFRCDAVDFVPTSFWTEALAALRAASTKELIFLAEGAERDNFTAGFPMNYAWAFTSSLHSAYAGGPATGIVTMHLQEFSQVPSGGSKLRFTTNHDQYAYEGSPVSFYTLQGSVGAFVLASFMGGVPMIYSGQEIGFANNIPFMQSFPLNWTQQPAILAAYQQLMEVRKDLTAVKYGSFQHYSTADVVAFRRADANEEVLVLVNIRNRTVNYTWPTSLTQEGWTDLLSEEPFTNTTTMELRAHEYVLLRRAL